MSAVNPKIFKEYDIRARYPEEIDKSTAYKLGRAFAVSVGAKKIAVGRDMRKESKIVLPEFIRGARDEGVRIYDLGVCSTPELGFAVGHKDLDGGVISTASHNPKGYAGFKMIDRHGQSLGMKTGLKEIKRLASSSDVIARKPSRATRNVACPPWAGPTKLDIRKEYFKLITKGLDLKSLKSLKLVLDVGDGSGGKMTSYVFSRIPAKSTKMNFKINDKYPNRASNPMIGKNQRPAKHVLIAKGADVAILWDGDADRCVFIDENGKFVHPYYINCLLAEIILKKKKGMTVITDARLPVGVGKVIKSSGGRQAISRSGTANIMKMMLTKNIHYGCENSGHYFFNFKYFKKQKKDEIFSASIYPALLVLEYIAKNNLKISEAVAEYMNAYPISGEINFEIRDFDKLKTRLKNKYKGKRFSTVDGLSIFDRDWFINVRPSHTEPVARLNIEAKDKKVLLKMKKEMFKIIK